MSHEIFWNEDDASTPLLSSIDGKNTKVEYMEAIKTSGEIFYQFSKDTPIRIWTLIGQIVAKALFEGIPLEPKLTHFLLRCMLSQELEVEDLRTFDQYLMSSLGYIKDNMINSKEMNLTFTVLDKQNGCVELIEGGSDRQVNNYNKKAYTKLFLEYYGFHRSKDQINAFLEGVKQVIPLKVFNKLTLEDLEKLLVGKRKIDLADWRENTNYTGENFSTEHPTILSFWKTLSSLTDDELRKFLQFWTGCRSVPIDGFRSLKNNRQEEWLFTINLVSVRHTFIRAHTCFNRIDLPELSGKSSLSCNNLYYLESELHQSIDYILSQEQFKFDFE